MNPIAMMLLLLVTLGAFAFSAWKRWRLLHIGTGSFPTDHPRERFRRMIIFALGQKRMGRYPLAGFAHKFIFFGFLVLMLRSLILFGRGFVDDPQFGYWLFDGGTPLGNLYGLIKDGYVLLVIFGVCVFLYYRVVVRLPRMSKSLEGVVILLIILVMMFADILYDGAEMALAAQTVGTASSFNIWEPLGSLIAPVLETRSEGTLTALAHLGFWTHATLVLIFLNILPYSKHFHIITAIPNVYLQDITPPGRLAPIQDLEGRLEREETLGVRVASDLSVKAILDLYTCTECGRCSDHCPAFTTGKKLSPKQFTVNLRNHLYENETSLITPASNGENGKVATLADLVPAVIEEEVLWACTTCRACEQECPVFISYVDTIVDLRRHLVQERGEFPAPLQEAFQNMEVTGSPYGIAADERLAWAEGIDVPIRAETGEVDVLFWVGCAGAFDDRAKAVSRAVAQLLNKAGVKWAVLGSEEMCTGDVARRTGHEFLFQMMAQQNIETLNGYETKTIITACPHCFNTLKNEYPDFDGQYEVMHHAEYLAGLVRDGRLKPTASLNAKVTYHDSCYLGRYNEQYAEPRGLLKSIPGLELVEPEATRDRGLCCGAGGGQMFKEEEEGTERVNHRRYEQLSATGADVVSSACPFCMRMLTDAANAKDDAVTRQADIAELLWESVEAVNP